MRISGLGICFGLLLLSQSYGLSQNLQLDSIENSLIIILASSAKLGTELTNLQTTSAEQKQRIDSLLSELGILRTRLEVSGTLLSKYKQRVEELKGIIRELETRLSQLSESYERTVKPLQEALEIAEKELRVQKIKTVVWSIIAGVLGVGMGLGLSVIF
ncbi:hypothetical protein LCGC14_1906250 [marine sediment metagenome]|uniref:Uncharacterized protein n=1 Tax=marine sediment metagenome TaxID=412755 RepID=A0A0F9FV54_9ZZZZ